MKKAFLPVGFFFILFVLFSPSCTPLRQAPKFASVENVMSLKLNFSLAEVISTLGSRPYNIYYHQEDGYTIYTYKYKLVERKVKPMWLNSRGGETNGIEVYSGKLHTLYLLFKDGKLETFVTSDGRDDAAALIMLNNTVYKISTERDSFILNPIPAGKSESSLPLPLPLKGKKLKLF